MSLLNGARLIEGPLGGAATSKKVWYLSSISNQSRFANTIMETKKQYEFSAVLSPELVHEIGQDIRRVHAAFKAQAFYETTAPHLEGKLVKKRGEWIAEQLYQYLPKDPAQSIAILTASLGPKLGDAANFGSAFKYLPHGTFVSQHGLEPVHFEVATRFLYEMTQRFSAEFAIRPFLMRYPDRMLPLLQQWANDPNQHVRRLVSEGTRTRLPWGMRVTAYDSDYAPIMALLEQLHQDQELYVRRSVANHLNDLTKDRPELVLDALAHWQETDHEHLPWVTKHALRTLLKAGHPKALALLGFQAEVAVNLEALTLAQSELLLGEQQVITAELASTGTVPQQLMMDYLVFYKKANGQLQPKVFKWKTFTLAPGERLVLHKKHPFRSFSTRKVYPGLHRIALQINGQVLGEASFELLFPPKK